MSGTAAERRSPFRKFMGVNIRETAPGWAVVTMAARPELINRWGAVHGGAISTLADAGLGTAIHTLLTANDHAATIELKVNYCAPSRGDLEARAKVLHLGGSTGVADCEIYDAQGRLCAKCLGTFMIKRGDKRIDTTEE